MKYEPPRPNLSQSGGQLSSKEFDDVIPSLVSIRGSKLWETIVNNLSQSGGILSAKDLNMPRLTRDELIAINAMHAMTETEEADIVNELKRLFGEDWSVAYQAIIVQAKIMQATTGNPWLACLATHFNNYLWPVQSEGE